MPIWKIPTILSRPNNHFPLQSELLGWWILDQFEAVNLPVISICPSVRWLLRCCQSQPRFGRFRLFFFPPNNHLPLQSELLGWWSLDQFDGLNLPVISLCP